MLDPLERLLDTKSAGALIGISPSTLAAWRKREIGPPYIRIDDWHIRYRLRDLNEWVRQLRNHFRPTWAWKGLTDDAVDRILDTVAKRDSQKNRYT